MQPYVQTLITAQAAGTALSSFTSAASLLQGTTQAKYTFPANYFKNIGDSLRVEFELDVSNVAAAPTFTFTWVLGATAVWSSGAMQTSTTAHTTLPVTGWVNLTARSVGATMQFAVQGWVLGQPFSLAADSTTTTASTLPAPNVTPALSTAVDGTGTLQADLQAACSVSNAANLVQMQQYRIISLGSVI